MLTARWNGATSDSHATHSVGTEREKNDTDCSLRENSFIGSVRLLKVAPQQGSIPGLITGAKCCANEGITWRSHVSGILVAFCHAWIRPIASWADLE